MNAEIEIIIILYHFSAYSISTLKADTAAYGNEGITLKAEKTYANCYTMYLLVELKGRTFQTI